MNNFCLIKNINNPEDTNGYGSTDHNFLIGQSFISCEEYVNFLNSVSIYVDQFHLYNKDIAKIVEKRHSVYTLKKDVYPYSPIRYINLENLKIYCNFLNNQDLRTIEQYPYNIYDNSVSEQDLLYWIPSYNEWYKATYYDAVNNKYYAFPNGSDTIQNQSEQGKNTYSPYGVINAGLKLFTIINDQNTDLDYLIAGGSSHRHPIHSKSGTKYYVSKDYKAKYISARICKKSATKKYTIKLYDTFGDGWGDNYILINDANHKPISEKLFIKHGYGPVSIDIYVDKVEKNFNIKYFKQNHLSYENYYELYDGLDNLLFSSNMYETPPINTIIPIL